jgi:hypothetical protein
MYSEEEIGEIRDILQRKRTFSNQEIGILRNEFEGKIQGYHAPFAGLFITNPELYNKITKDNNVRMFSLFGFFPETIELVYGSETSPELTFETGNRGMVGIIKHPLKNVVIKPVQSNREPEIAQIASELEVGPKQYRSLDGFLTEQFVDADLFPRLKGDRTSADNMYVLGMRMGDILTKLHSKEIYYNDTTLTDDLGRSHYIVPKTTPAILFDYGVALKLDKHPDLSDEEVFNFAQTITYVKMNLAMNSSEKQVRAVIEQYKLRLKKITKEQIMARDVEFIEEGLRFADYRLGNHVAEPFSKGFKETYRG